MADDLSYEELLDEEERLHEEAAGSRARRVVLRCGSSIVPEQVSFLWEPWVPLRSLTIFTGEPGLAKTTMGLHMLARLTRGTLPGEFYGRPSKVAVWSGEDSAAMTLVPRLAAAQADLDLVQFVTVMDDGIEDGLSLPGDVDLLTPAIADDVAAFLVDPLMAAVSDGVDAHRDHSMRRVLAPLFRLADSTGIAVVAISHLNKATGGGFIQRVGGSVGLTGAVRSGVLFARDPERPDDENARVMVHGKHNLSAPAPTQRFDVTEATIETDPPITTVMIKWGDEAPHLTAEDVLRGPMSEERPKPKLDGAKELLIELLVDGPIRRDAIVKEAKVRDISWRTVETAKAELDIDDAQIPEPGKQGRGPSYWFFPDHGPSNGPQPNGTQPVLSDEIADHFADVEPAPFLGFPDSESNGPQGPHSSRDLVADHSAGGADTEHDRARLAAAEAFE